MRHLVIEIWYNLLWEIFKTPRLLSKFNYLSIASNYSQFSPPPRLPQLYGLKLPNHWLRDLFYAEASLELQLTDDALSYYTNLSLAGFEGSPYIQNQLALVYYNKKSEMHSSS